MSPLELLFGKRCDHDDHHITDTIKDNFSVSNNGTFANETDVVTCSKCGRYYFINRGRKKQE